MVAEGRKDLNGVSMACNVFSRVPACDELYPLEQARNFKSDIEKNLEMHNFAKALSISKVAQKCVDACLKQPFCCPVERKVLEVFRNEFNRYTKCIIPSRQRDLNIKMEKEKQILLLAQRNIDMGRVGGVEDNGSYPGPGGAGGGNHASNMDSLYYIVNTDDYSSMHPIQSVYNMNYLSSSKNHQHQQLLQSVHNLNINSIVNEKCKASHLGMNNDSSSSASDGANNAQHVRIFLESSSIRPITTVDPLELCNNESLHCSFYDNFTAHSPHTVPVVAQSLLPFLSTLNTVPTNTDTLTTQQQ